MTRVGRAVTPAASMRAAARVGTSLSRCCAVIVVVACTSAWLVVAMAIVALPSQSLAWDKLLIKAKPGNPPSQKVVVIGEPLTGSPPPVDLYPSRLRVITFGATPSDQSFDFTPVSWSEKHNTAFAGGPPDGPSGVKMIKLTSLPARPAVKIILSGKEGPVNIVAPNAGTSAQIAFYVNGVTYACIEFGGAVDGTVVHNDADVWEIKHSPPVTLNGPCPPYIP
jgi:hypothetical protein